MFPWVLVDYVSTQHRCNVNLSQTDVSPKESYCRMYLFDDASANNASLGGGGEGLTLWRERLYTLQMHCTENSKQIFREMKLRRLVPSFYIPVSVSVLCFPTIGQQAQYIKIGG